MANRKSAENSQLINSNQWLSACGWLMCENGYVMKEILFMYNMSISNAEN
jgi:hypothetical protein